MLYVGLDVHSRQSSLCILNAGRPGTESRGNHEDRLPGRSIAEIPCNPAAVSPVTKSWHGAATPLGLPASQTSEPLRAREAP